jgi:iron(III) transport system substrate-binding protein
VRSPSRLPILALAGVLLVAACSGGGASPSAEAAPSLGGSLTIYAGRSEELVGPLIERFETETGVTVEVNYAGTTDLAATILEEGDASPADVFFAQDAGALGAVAAEGRLATLPAETLNLVDARFRSDDGQWVGASGRARVVVYDSRVLDDGDLPTSIDAFTDPAWKGRSGWAPTNASFQSFVTAYRVLKGDEAAKAWLEGIVANEPKVYEGNDAILAAVAAGEVEVGFANHYYLLQAIAEQGETFPVRNHFLAGDDPGSLINVAGVGILTTSPNPTAAQAFVDFLLSAESQAYFSTETHEYPLIDGVDADPALPPLADIESPAIDLSDLSDLEGTLQLLQDAGVL